MIGHPAGQMDVDIEIIQEDGCICVKKAAFSRTARRLMDGMVYIKPDAFMVEWQEYNIVLPESSF